jgi:hypothetical protein
MSPSSYQIQGKLKKHLDSYIDAQTNTFKPLSL